ncbi:glycosyltransferase family 4 protein [Kocuria sp. M1R5S2]|uniref:glycosyltransferase family 4 protein n=1 Tax=Kocuria rhizosphaerae TaxID=3376285 RepID=UPI0037B0BA47
MKISLVTPWNVDDPRAWSGVVQPMVRHLRDVADIVVVPCGQEAASPVDRVAAGAFGRAAGKPYLTGHAVATARRRGRALTDRLANVTCDVVLGIAASAPLAYTGTERPIVQVTDATFGAITGYYPLFTGLPAIVRRQGETIERRSALKTAGWVVASRWAANSLMQDYAVHPDKVRVAPFGPATNPTEIREKAPSKGLRALLVTSNWERKGGALALAAVEQARAAGTPVQLTVVGDHPVLPDHVTSLGRLPAERMSQVYAEHDVLLELAAANAGGVTLTDAAHAGLPVIATRTGGVPDIVRDGVSGFLVPVGAEGPVFAARQLLAMSRPEVHEGLVRGSRQHARDVLSWDRWAHQVLEACVQVTEGLPASRG